MFSFKSLVSGALVLGINSLLIIKPMDLSYRCYNYTFFQYFLICIIVIYIDIACSICYYVNLRLRKLKV